MSHPHPQTHHQEQVPKGALLGIAGLILFSLLAVSIARFTGFRTGEETPSPVTESRYLRFEDAPGGVIHVYEWDSGAMLATYAPGTENFVRGVLRGLVRERRSRDIGAETPFRVARHQDGALTLEDPATGRRINLWAFGPDNVRSFSRLLATLQPDPD
jgi:putative photosynthetic complex assembly protein